MLINLALSSPRKLQRNKIPKPRSSLSSKLATLAVGYKRIAEAATKEKTLEKSLGKSTLPCGRHLVNVNNEIKGKQHLRRRSASTHLKKFLKMFPGLSLLPPGVVGVTGAVVELLFTVGEVSAGELCPVASIIIKVFAYFWNYIRATYRFTRYQYWRL